MNNTLNVQLPIYKSTSDTTTELQQRFRLICKDKMPSFRHPNIELPAFVFKRGFSADEITNIRYENVITEVSTSVAIGTQYNYTNVDGDTITAWNGASENLECGFYYYVITCGEERFYSDVWSAVDDLNSLNVMPETHCKISVKPTCLYNGIPFDQFTDFQIDTYLETEPLVPEYSETVESRESDVGVTTVESFKKVTDYLLVVKNAYQPLVDYFQHLKGYQIETGAIKLMIPNDTVAKTVQNIEVEDVIYIDECIPSVKLRVRIDSFFDSHCEDEDLCKFRSVAPILVVASGTNIEVSGALDDFTFVEIFYRENSLGGYTTVDGYFTAEEIANGVLVDVGSNSVWQFNFRIYKHGCTLKQGGSTVIAN